MLGAILFASLPCMQIDNNYVGLILAFVGIIATFVVVSNYSQIKDIEYNVYGKLDGIIEDNTQKLKKLEEKTDNKIHEIDTIKDTYDRLLEQVLLVQKNIYEQQIRSYYPRLQEYLSIMSKVSTMSIWKNNKIALMFAFNRADGIGQEELRDYIRKYPFLDIQLRIQYMANVYSRIIQDESSELLSYQEIEELYHSADAIWWSYDREWNYFSKEINEDAFVDNIDEYTTNKFLRISHELVPDNKSEKFNYATIAIISGHVETDILAPLKVLMSKYETTEQTKKSQ